MTSGAGFGSGTHDFVVESSETIHEGAIIALRADRVVMPGGHLATREVVEHHGAVAVVAADEHDRIAMVRQYRHPVGRRLLELPAGLLDQGPAETPLRAAQRELAEEADLAAAHWDVLIDLTLSPGFTDEALRLFLATGLTRLHAAARHDEEADMSLEWVGLDDAVDRVLSGEIVNATAVSGILAYAAVRRHATGAVQGTWPLRNPEAPWPDRPTALSRRKGR
ncbi:MAG: NUDIX hydrolase [Gordonia sp. (in: high G+C Gram-positive bacteria)]